MRYPFVLIAPLLLLGGCGSDKIECGTPADLAGNWTYAGVQSAPTAANLTGTMSLTTSGTCTFDGHLSVSVDNGSGTPTLLDGSVSGVFLDDSTVDFTAQLSGERRHLGVVRADSIVGSWSGGTSGTFHAVRGPA
jgi:hypothetical protein